MGVQKTWRRVSLSAAAVGLTVAALVFPSSLTAHADPDAVKAAQAKLEKIEQEGAEMAESYAALDGRRKDAQVKIDQLTRDITKQQATIKGQVGSMSQLARMQYQSNGVDVTTRLLASPDDTAFIRNLATVQSVSSLTNDRVQSFQLEQSKLQAARTKLDAVKKQVEGDKAQQAALIKQQNQREQQAREVVAKLTEEEKKRLAAERKAKAEAEARRIAQQEAASRDAERTSQADDDQTATTPSSSSSSSSPKPKSDPTQKSTETKRKTQPKAPAGSSRGQIAASYALSKVGGAYVNGGTGPTAFDCSGLTSSAWKAAGVSIPRTSQAQFGVGVPVSVSELQPGDLVFYYSGISHVGIYVGNGKIVDAANRRAGVRMTTVTGNYMPFMGARRVG